MLIQASCKDSVAPKVPFLKKISKTWKAKIVKEGATTVYTQGTANNAVPAYANFRLTLQETGTASLKEFNGDVFNGNWELLNDNKKLKLSKLIPEPTYTGGIIEYVVVSGDENQLVLSRTNESIKTGNTINEYTLIPQ
jgi:hypothetical protein